MTEDFDDLFPLGPGPLHGSDQALAASEEPKSDAGGQRGEHLAWAKRRALEYVELGELSKAVASMMSDLSNYPEFCGGIYPALFMLGMMAISSGLDVASSPASLARQKEKVRYWIEGFN